MRISHVLMAASLILLTYCKFLFWKWSYLEGLGQAVGFRLILSFWGATAFAIFLNYRIFSAPRSDLPIPRASCAILTVYDLGRVFKIKNIEQ